MRASLGFNLVESTRGQLRRDRSDLALGFRRSSKKTSIFVGGVKEVHLGDRCTQGEPVGEKKPLGCITSDGRPPVGEEGISHRTARAPTGENLLSEQEAEVCVSRLRRNFELAICGLRGTRSLRSTYRWKWESPTLQSCLAMDLASRKAAFRSFPFAPHRR